MRNQFWRLPVFVLILASLAATGASGANDSPGAVKAKPLPLVQVETVKTAPLSQIIDLTGTVVPTRTARIASPGEGPVETCAAHDCLVREGDWVARGQVLLQISRKKGAEATLLAARQALKEQETELRRIEQLVQAGAIPAAQLDAARSNHEATRAQLAKARENSDDYSVSAPWDGIVYRVHVTEGDYVAPRAPLIEIFDPASLVVQFAVPEARSTEVRQGLPVRVRLDAHNGKTFQGKISRVFPHLDERMRTRTVEATLDGPVTLLPGMFARVQIILAVFDDAVTAPVEAVLMTNGKERMVFVAEEGKARLRRVSTGIEAGGRLQILSGLKPGEQVIVAGQEKLKDGAAIRLLGGTPSEPSKGDSGTSSEKIPESSTGANQ